MVDQPEQTWGKVNGLESQYWTLGMQGSSWAFLTSIMDVKLMEWRCLWGLGPPVPIGSERPSHTESQQ